MPENTTSVMTVTATDADLPSQAVTFSIVGGADQSKFTITSGGVLSFNSPPDFEAPDRRQRRQRLRRHRAGQRWQPAERAGDSWSQLRMSTNRVALAGDYNNNGNVDAADYVVWRQGARLVHRAAERHDARCGDAGRLQRLAGELRPVGGG